jgi:hypothetical protein
MRYLESISPSTLLFGVSALLFIAARLLWPLQIPRSIDFVESRKFWMPVCGILFAAYLALLALSTTYLGFCDHVEPNIAAVSSLAGRGAPLYHGLESTQRYSLLYGPMSYLPFVWALRIFGPHVLSVKMVVLFLNAALLALLWHSYRMRVNMQQAMLATVLVLPFLLAGEPYLIQIRGDVVMLVAAALGLRGALSASRWRAGLLLAAGAGICVAAKITGGLYFVPLFVMLYRRHGIPTTAITLLGAGFFACLPFAWPAVSIPNYFLWLREAGRHPLAGFEVVRNVKTLVTFSVPIALLFWRLYERDRQAFFNYIREEKLFLLSLAASIGLMSVTASKLGSGEHHYLPFYPLLGYLCCDLHRRAETVLGGIGRSSLRASVSILLCFWLVARVGTRDAWGWTLTGPHVLDGRKSAAEVTRDLQEIMRSHPGEVIEMGYGDNLGKASEVTYLRPLLVFAGNPLTVDEAALDDMELSKLAMPQSTIAYVQSCQTQIWLIPKGERPFLLPSFYDDLGSPMIRDIFGNAFREVFFARYQKRETSTYFDLWSCDGKKPSG